MTSDGLPLSGLVGAIVVVVLVVVSMVSTKFNTKNSFTLLDDEKQI